MKMFFAASFSALFLFGCAVAPAQMDYSLIDPQGVDMNRYQADYDACAGLANQTDVAANAAVGAGIGGLIFGILGGAICGRECAKQGAAFGVGYGVTSGAVGGVAGQQTTLRACLTGRGYHVIR